MSKALLEVDHVSRTITVTLPSSVWLKTAQTWDYLAQVARKEGDEAHEDEDFKDSSRLHEEARLLENAVRSIKEKP